MADERATGPIVQRAPAVYIFRPKGIVVGKIRLTGSPSHFEMSQPLGLSSGAAQVVASEPVIACHPDALPHSKVIRAVAAISVVGCGVRADHGLFVCQRQQTCHRATVVIRHYQKPMAVKDNILTDMANEGLRLRKEPLELTLSNVQVVKSLEVFAPIRDSCSDAVTLRTSNRVAYVLVHTLEQFVFVLRKLDDMPRIGSRRSEPLWWRQLSWPASRLDVLRIELMLIHNHGIEQSVGCVVRVDQGPGPVAERETHEPSAREPAPHEHHGPRGNNCIMFVLLDMKPRLISEDFVEGLNPSHLMKRQGIGMLIGERQPPTVIKRVDYP